MKRTAILQLAAWLAAFAAPSCTIEQGETPPRRTEGEYAVFRTIDLQNRNAAKELLLAAGLDEYLAQTTDEGREAVCRRFFDWGRVARTADGAWTLTGSGQYYLFQLRDGLRLGEAGAAWEVRKANGQTGAVEFLYSLTSAADGALRSRVAFADPESEAALEWSVRFSVTETEIGFTAESGEGRILLSGYDRYRDPDPSRRNWTVEYRFGEPYRLSVTERKVSVRQRLAAKARSEVPERRELRFEASQTDSDEVTITRDGLGETWWHNTWWD